VDDGIRVQVRGILQSEITIIHYCWYFKVGMEMDDLIKLIPVKFRKWYIFVLGIYGILHLCRLVNFSIFGGSNSGPPLAPSLQIYAMIGRELAFLMPATIYGLFLYWRYVYKK